MKGILKKAALCVLLPLTVQAQTTVISWTPPTTTEDGELIDPAWELQYRFYARVDQQNGAFVDYMDTPELSIDLSEAPADCYEFYVTTIVVNISPMLESAPSDSVIACINLACGEVGTDGSTGFCAGDVGDPNTDPDVDPDIIIHVPAPPTEILMR
jgi:hypothetical protein